MMHEVATFKLTCNQYLLHLLHKSSGLRPSEVVGKLRELGMPLLKRVEEHCSSGRHSTTTWYNLPFPNTEVQLKFVMNAYLYTEKGWFLELSIKLPPKNKVFNTKMIDELLLESTILDTETLVKPEIGKSRLAKRLLDT